MDVVTICDLYCGGVELETDRIYIAGPITGVDDYKSNFEEAENELLDRGYVSIINPAAVSMMLPRDFDHDEYMAVCLNGLLPLCEAIYMLRGYENSKGAMKELKLAKEMEIGILYQEGAKRL